MLTLENVQNFTGAEVPLIITQFLLINFQRLPCPSHQKTTTTATTTTITTAGTTTIYRYKQQTSQIVNINVSNLTKDKTSVSLFNI